MRCSWNHGRDIYAGGSTKLDRPHEVVREHLSAIFGAIGRQRIDPVRDAQMRVRTGGTGHLAIGTVTDQYVHEDVLARSRNRRSMLPAHELLPLERMQLVVEHPLVEPGECREGIAPEHLSEDGRLLEDFLPTGRKPV